MTDLLALYPCLDGLPDGWAHELARAPRLDVPPGTVLFEPGATCPGFPLVLDGDVRVVREDLAAAGTARSLELYRVTPGEICLVSAASLLGPTPVAARGSAAAPTQLLLLPPPLFLQLTAVEPFRHFVFGQFAARLADLMAVVDAVAFQRLDQRLAAALLGRGAALHLTHQALADELGTVREIVTRLLKRFEQAGWVELGRERIRVLQPQALRERARGRAD